MKLTIIKPNIGRQAHNLYVDEARMEPLQLGVLAALTPPDVEVKLYDDRIESIPYDEPTDLVAITVETYTARRSYEIAAKFREQNVPVIMGGMHVKLLPSEVSEHADSIFIGDAETLWTDVIADANTGRLKSVYVAEPGVPQPGILTRRDIYKGKGYLPLTLIQFGRGCKNSCEFCATSVYFNQKHYKRDVQAGPAILSTTVILILGFSVLLLSEAPPIVNFGLLSITALSTALLGDLLLLPYFMRLLKTGHNS